MAEVIIPWVGVTTEANDIDDLIHHIVGASKRGFTLYSISWVGHADGYSGFCSRSGYGGQTSGSDIVSGIVLVPSDGAYMFYVNVNNSSGEVKFLKKTRSSWA